MATTETAIQIEKDIEDLSYMAKFDQFINLANYIIFIAAKLRNVTIVMSFVT